MNLTTLILLVLKISIVLSVLALGLKVTFEDTTFLFRKPGLLARAFLSMNVIMPTVALLLVLIFDLSPAVKIALVAVSVSPVPPVFPKKVLKEGGRDDYTIGLLASAAVLAIVVIPITIKIFERVGGVPLSMPVRSVATLVLMTVLAPLLAGIALRSVAPSMADKCARPIGIVASTLLIMSLVPVVAGSLRTMFSLIGNGTIVAMSVFALIGFVSGYIFGGPEAGNRSVLAKATASRHPGIAVAIAHANFPAQKLAVPAIALYLIVVAILTALTFRKSARAKASPPETEAQAV